IRLVSGREDLGLAHAVQISEPLLETTMHGVGAVGRARAGRRHAVDAGRRSRRGDDVGMKAQSEVVVRAAHQCAPALDDDLCRTVDLLDARIEWHRAGTEMVEPVARGVQFVEETHTGTSRSATSSVPATRRLRVSARRTLPLVVRGMVPGGVTTTRSSSKP